MPPNMVDSAKDEKAWARAKKRAAKQGHAEDWPYVVSIYQSMTGRKGAAKGPLGPMVDVLRKAMVDGEPVFMRPSGSNPYCTVSGIKCYVENYAGTERKGYLQTVTYSEIIGSVGADGEAVDAFLGQHVNADMAYVIDQLDANGEVDEHKVMLGFLTAEDAARAYVGQMPTAFMGGMVALRPADLARYLLNNPEVSAEPFADLLAESGTPFVRVWAPLSGMGPISSPAVVQANGGV